MSNRESYPVGYFESIRPKVIKMILNRYRIKDIAEHIGIKHMTLANMMLRDGLSAVRVRHEHKRDKAA